MAAPFTPSHHTGERAPIHIKREPTEDCREHYERSMDMSHYQASNGHLDPARHQGPPSVYGMESYSPYGNPYDQRVVNPLASYPQQYSHHREDSDSYHHNKEMNNYALHSNSPVGLHNNAHAVSSESEQTDPGSDIPVLKIKRSNGKLALPDILRGDGEQDIDLISLTTHQRAKREFVPDNKKDEGYWNKRVKNNDSARRSRVKRKALEKIMETRLVELQQENIELRHEMNALKRRFGIADESTPNSPTYGNMKGSLDSVLDDMSPSPEKLSKEDELEQQSSASDDSRSLDDARSCYNVRSVSVLSQSFDSANRDRADSLGSNGSSAANRSPNSSNSSSPPASWEYSYVKTDQSGALDLTNDFAGRSAIPTLPTLPKDYPSSLPKDYPSSEAVVASSGSEMDTLHCNSSGSNIINSNSMRGIPLKCRWKYSSSVKNTTDSSASFPGA